MNLPAYSGYKNSFMRFLAACCLFFTCLASVGAYGQSLQKQDSITASRRGLNYIFSQNGNTLTHKELTVVTRNCTAAKEEISKAKNLEMLGVCLGGAGGGLIGFQLGSALSGQKMSPVALGAGVCLAGLSMYISTKADKRRMRAVEEYNRSLRRAAQQSFNPQFYMSFTGTGVGLTMKF